MVAVGAFCLLLLVSAVKVNILRFFFKNFIKKTTLNVIS